MGIDIALIDKSETTKKIISHSLKQYSPSVKQFVGLEDLTEKSKDTMWDAIFADWNLVSQNQNLFFSIQEFFPDSPIVVLYREENSDLENIKYKLKKPLDSNSVCELIKNCIPDLNKFELAKHLKYNFNNQLNLKQELPEKYEEELNLDTLDSIDLAKETPVTSSQSIPLNKDLILQVLNEYKQTLEFEKILEKPLNEQAEKIAQQMTSSQGKEFLEKSFREYKENPEFLENLYKAFRNYLTEDSHIQKQMEISLQKFMEDKLPEMAKQILKEEIKNILNKI